MSEGNGAAKIEIQFDREDVLDLQLLEERKARLQAQMQLLQRQAQDIHTEIEAADKARAIKVSAMNDKYGMDVSKFSIDTDTCIATGTAPLSPHCDDEPRETGWRTPA